MDSQASEQEPRPEQTDDPITPPVQPFPLVGIGASAGGLQALQQFFAHMPPDCGMAFVVILHLSRTHESNAAAVLQHSTPMSVLQVTETLPVAHAIDGEAIAHGRIYVAPPDRHLLVEHDRIRLTRGPKENRFRPAIDPLFRSAARYGGGGPCCRRPIAGAAGPELPGRHCDHGCLDAWWRCPGHRASPPELPQPFRSWP